jgi:hypothetical protein
MASAEDHEQARRVLAIRTPSEEDEEQPLDLLKLEDPRYMREQARLTTSGNIAVLVEIRDNPVASETARINVAKLLLAYGWGTPCSQAEILKLFLETDGGHRVIDFVMPMTVDGSRDEERDEHDGRARPQDL